MRYLIMILSFIAVQVGSAMNFGEIQGRVLDEYGEGMPGANVQAIGPSGDILVSTDVNGRYKIKPLLPGVYSLNITYSGYHPQPITEITVDPEKITFASTVNLTPDTEALPEVQVDAVRYKLIDPEETSRVTMRTSEIKSNALRNNPIDMIATMKSDIKKGVDGELYFRGSRTGAVQYNIDGVKMTNSNLRVPSAAIGSISVYTGGLPAKYGDTTGGVIVLETRSYMDLYLAEKYRK